LKSGVATLILDLTISRKEVEYGTTPRTGVFWALYLAKHESPEEIGKCLYLIFIPWVFRFRKTQPS